MKLLVIGLLVMGTQYVLGDTEVKPQNSESPVVAAKPDPAATDTAAHLEEEQKPTQADSQPNRRQRASKKSDKKLDVSSSHPCQLSQGSKPGTVSQ